MWHEPSARALRLRRGLRLGWRLGWALAVLVPCVWGCNVAIGAGLVAVAGTAGFLASQCYDEVRIRVRDESGQSICDAAVTLSEGDSVSSLRPCYHASLTEGRWRVDARREGYLPVSTEIIIPEHEGSCPHYTHSVELTLRRVGAPSEPSQLRPQSPTPTPAAAPAAAAPETPPAAAAGAAPPAPAPQPPTAGFPAVPAPGGAPPPSGGAPPPSGTPAPAPAAPGAPAAPAPPPAPSPAPGP